MNSTGDTDTLQAITELENVGILREYCPGPGYWHWQVLQPKLLPHWLMNNYINYGEIRYYWH